MDLYAYPGPFADDISKEFKYRLRFAFMNTGTFADSWFEAVLAQPVDTRLRTVQRISAAEDYLYRLIPIHERDAGFQELGLEIALADGESPKDIRMTQAGEKYGIRPGGPAGKKNTISIDRTGNPDRPDYG